MTSSTAAVDAGVLPTSKNFFKGVLASLGLPVTTDNLRALYSVEQLEGANDRYNPINVIQPEPGSTDFNSVGVQAYDSFDTGVEGTATLLQGSAWNGVRAALAQGNSISDVLSAFQGVYAGWDPGVKFPTGSGVWRTQATRDVGPDGGSLASQIGNMNGTPSPDDAATLTSDSTSSSGGSSWTELLPWNWGSDVKGAEQSVVNTIVSFVTKMIFVVGGVVLVLLGAYSSIKPAADRAGKAVTSAATTAAAVAA